MSELLPEYARPPLNEVAIGLQFEPLQKLGAEHLGLYWNGIRDRYPSAQTHTPISHVTEGVKVETGETIGETIVFGIPIPIPRCWFVDKRGCELVQLQQDRFHRNWRQLRADESYPRFPALFQEFKAEWHGFLRFLEAEKLDQPVIDQCELTYTNHIIPDPVTKGLPDPSTIFSMWRALPPGSFLPAINGIAWKITFPLPDHQGNLRAEMRPAVRKADRQFLFVLELTARGTPPKRSLDECFGWFELAHEWIVRGFTDLTTEEMHKRWGRTR